MIANSRSAFATRAVSSGTASVSTTSYAANPYITKDGSPIILTYYSQLSDILDTLIKLFYNFSIGNYEYVDTHLTDTLYYNLSIKLLSLQQDGYVFPDYENFRITITRGLEGIKKAMNLYKTLEGTKITLEMVQARADILDNMDKLKEFINNLGGAVSIFNDVTVTSVAAQLKPEIAIYLKLYGYPEGGVFEMEKLANAINLANIQATQPAP
jgi:hypothetical protein